jgi:hypothetical protein
VLLLEEPENDLHPEALRELLSIILESVDEHGYQVVVSTHSDLVLRTLGSASGAVVYQTCLSYSETGLPTTTYTHLDSAIDRRQALADLGYDVSHPVGWLIFEESSAETFFLRILIPHFAPELAGFRTLAASGTGNVPRLVEDLRRFMLFVQKSDEEPTPRAWVVVDGDEAGKEAVAKLTETFRKWPEDRFIALHEAAKVLPAQLQQPRRGHRGRARRQGRLAGAAEHERLARRGNLHMVQRPRGTAR